MTRFFTARWINHRTFSAELPRNQLSDERRHARFWQHQGQSEELDFKRRSGFKLWSVIWFEADENKTIDRRGVERRAVTQTKSCSPLATRKGRNVAYIDGHVEWWNPDDYQKYSTA